MSLKNFTTTQPAEPRRTRWTRALRYTQPQHWQLSPSQLRLPCEFHLWHPLELRHLQHDAGALRSAEIELQGIHSSDIGGDYPANFANRTIEEYLTSNQFAGTRIRYTGYNFPTRQCPAR